MKENALVLSIVLMWNGLLCHATNLSPFQTNLDKGHTLNHSSKSNSMFKQVNPKLLYSFIDFNFDSTSGANFNRFQGHSNLYSGGADHIILAPRVFAGLFIFDIETSISSQLLLSPAKLVASHTNIKNNTLFGHLFKVFNQHLFLDVAGAYGQNSIFSYTELTPIPILGLSGSTNHNWFYSINGLYRNNWGKVLFKASVGSLFNEVTSNTAFVVFQAIHRTQIINPLTSKAAYIMENMELGYKLSSIMTPFINGGLIQVAYFSTNRPVLNAVNIIGALPQLEMNQNAYRIGAGISFKFKQFTIKLEQRYYNAAGTFISKDTIVNLSHPFG